MIGDRPRVPRRWGQIALGLSLLAAAAAHAGEVTIRSDRKVKVNLGGRRVLGVFEPEQGVVISGLRDGTHKIYVMDVETGEFDMVLVKLPEQSGQERRVDFGAATIRSTRPPPTPTPAPPRPAPQLPPEDPPPVAQEQAWKGDMSRLFDLHEVSLDTLEAMQTQLDRMKAQVLENAEAAERAAAAAPEPREAGRPPPGDVQVYAYVDSEATRLDSPGDKGSFDSNHGTLGIYGPVGGNWAARLEYTLQHGYTDSSTGTTGNSEMEQAFLERDGRRVDWKFGKMFNPFGFWSPNQYEVHNDTVQAPLHFDNLFSDTQTGLHAVLSHRGNHFGVGLFNGDGVDPAQNDDNDDKSFLLSWRRNDFMDGSVGLAYNHQRDGRQADRREEKWIASVDQDWGRVRLLSEYFFEKATRAGAITDNDSWYADLRFEFTEKFYSTLRFDWIRRDPNTSSDDHTRNLVNFGYQLSPTLRFKADFYEDRFAAVGLEDLVGMDVQVAAAIGL